jgi:two-component system sensor histidine kinase KdpD
MVSPLNLNDVFAFRKCVKDPLIKLKAAAVSRVSNPFGWLSISMLPTWRQYGLALVVFVLVTSLSFCVQPWLGYQAIALVYLLSVVLLALSVSRGATLFGTVLTAAGWNFFFAPPAFAFNISDSYDNMMLLTYFVVTLTVGQLTNRLRAHRDAELQAKLLAESEKLGRTLLRSVSHELRTPIAAINSAAHTLPSTGPLNKEQENLVGEIESASARLNRVVQSLLSAARIQSGQVRPKMEWCDMSDLIRVTLKGINSHIFSRRIRIFLPKNPPLVKADFVLTEQVLANLVVNAATYTKPETPIEIIGQMEEGYFALTVCDEGPGIPKDQLERIFDPFQRGDKAKTGGLGLGLAIVKGFMEVQGGHVKASNRGAGGAAFTIYFKATDQPFFPETIL